MTKKVSVIIGSLRRESFARKIAHNVMPMFGSDYELQILEIGHLPLYNCDFDDPAADWVQAPAEYAPFRQALKESDAVLFVTAENNRTIPACLKNAVDIGSKPASDPAWKHLPCGIISHSVGRMGGYSSQKNLRLALSYFDMPMTGQPEVFLGNSNKLIDEDGQINNQSTLEFLQKYVDVLKKLIEDNPRP